MLAFGDEIRLNISYSFTSRRTGTKIQAPFSLLPWHRIMWVYQGCRTRANVADDEALVLNVNSDGDSAGYNH